MKLSTFRACALALVITISGAASVQAQVVLHSSQPGVLANTFTTRGSGLVKGPSNSARAFWQVADNSWDGPWGLNGGAANEMFSAAATAVNSTNGLGVGVWQGPSARLRFGWQMGNGSWLRIGLNNDAPGSCFAKPGIVTDPVTGDYTSLVQGEENTVDLYWGTGNSYHHGPIGMSNGGRGICYGDISMAIDPVTKLIYSTFWGKDNSVVVMYQAVENNVVRWKGPYTIVEAFKAKSQPVISYNHVGGYAVVAFQNQDNTFSFVRNYASVWATPRTLTGANRVGKAMSGMSVVSDPVNGRPTWACVGPNNRTDVYWIDANGAYQGPLSLIGGVAKTSYSIPGMAIYKVPNSTQTVIKMLLVGEFHQLGEMWRTSNGTWYGRIGLKGDAPNMAY